MNIYICKRWSKKDDGYVENPWMGALIIAAESEQEAIEIYKKAEDEEPKQIVQISIEKGILYDDQLR